MDDAAFVPWLAKIGRWSASRRQRAWEALALSEASDDRANDRPAARDGGTTPVAAAKHLPAMAPRQPVDVAAASALGQALRVA